MSQCVPEIMSQCVPEIGGYGDDYCSVMPEIGSKGFESSAPIGRSTMFPHIRPSPKALNSKGQGISPDLEHYVPQAHTALAIMNDRCQLAELTWKDGQPAVQTLGRATKRSEARVPNLDTFFSSSSSLGSDDWISNDEYGLASYKRKNRDRIINNECSGSGNDNDDNNSKIEVLAGSLDSLPPIDEDMVFCFNALDMQRAQKDMPQPNTCIAPAFMESHSSNNFQYFSSAPESEAMLKPSLQNFISPEISDSISKLGQTQSCLEKTMNPMRAQSSCSIWEERGTTACDNGEEDEVMEGTLASNSLRSLSPTNDTSRLKRKSKSNHQEGSVFQSDDQETEVKEFFRGQNVRDRQFCRPKRSRAADVHNQSERRRRDRINERMKALQRLIPNSSKTDKASMLDEAIEYVKQLQSQLQMMMLRNQGMGMLPMMVPMNMQQLQMQMSMLASMNQMGFGMGMGMGMNGPLGMGMGMGMRMVDVNSPTINATPTLPSTTSVNAEPPPQHSGLRQSRATPSAATRDVTELSSFDLHNPYLQDFRSQPMNMDKYKSLLVQQRSHTPQQPSSSLRK